MYLVRLFHEGDAEHPVAAKRLDEGTMRVGRDPGADLIVSDPDREVSRTHLELIREGRRIALRPLGANGVFLPCGTELPREQDAPIAPGERVSFGKFTIEVTEAPEEDGPAPEGTMAVAAPFGDNVVPAHWTDDAPPRSAAGDGSLLDAFCEGAELDISAFAGADPAEVMRAAGAMYRQMVLGLGDLMRERSSAKNDWQLDRTTIGAKDNNPFKWAPTRRLAADLLLREDAGFLDGPAAARASFEDLKRHLLGTLAGFRASLDGLIAATRPAEVEKRVEGQKKLLQSRPAACWEEYVKLHAALEAEAAGGSAGPINRAFIQAYQDAMRAIDGTAVGG